MEQPHNSATPRVRTLWSILGTQGITVGVVGWPLTYPAPAMRGYLVSDVYQRLIQTPSGLDDRSAVYPPEIAIDVLRAIEGAETMPELQGSRLDRRHEAPGRTDRAYDGIARTLAGTRPTEVTSVRYQSLDAIGHYFLRYAMQRDFGDVTEDERTRFGPVL